MKTITRFLFSIAFILLAGVAAVVAQGQLEPATLPEPIGSTVTTVNAIEVTDGTAGYDSRTKDETAFGYTFLGRTTGLFPGSFTLAMNCTPVQAVAGETSQLTGGSWTLPVYLSNLRGSSYAGSLYGTITKGSMTWDTTATKAKVYFLLTMEGGTQAWQGVQGYATFAGTLDFDEKTQKKILIGELAFTIK